MHHLMMDIKLQMRVPERVILLRRWLAALKEVEKFNQRSSEDKPKSLEEILASEEAKDNPKRPSLVLYYDEDVGGAPMNFLEVFLQSQALEGIAASMVFSKHQMMKKLPCCRRYSGELAYSTMHNNCSKFLIFQYFQVADELVARFSDPSTSVTTPDQCLEDAV